MKPVTIGLIVVSLLALTACTDEKPHPSFGEVQYISADGPVAPYQFLQQNKTEQERIDFWFKSQGSRFIPYAWFAALEQKDSTELFRNTRHMASLRYIPVQSHDKNPSGLPIGFALDTDKKTGDKWLGFTCAACHTAQLEIKGNQYIVEGGPTMGNFNLLFKRLIAASENTLLPENTDKFDRFAKRVLAKNYSKELSKMLYQDFKAFTKKLSDRQRMNTASSEYPHDFIGYGRVDAFGIIKNAATALALNDPSNYNAVNAPVSYPFLWGTNQSDVVQWNGALPNTNFLGPLARNAGEVIGTFGGLEIRRAPWWRRWFLLQKNRYSATVKFENLGYLESWLRDLRSPMLKEVSPEVALLDTSRGRSIYENQCQNCHKLVKREEQHLPYNATMIRASVVGTDEVMTRNATDQVARTRLLEGVKLGIYFGEKFGPTEPGIKFAFNGTFGIMLNDPINTYRAAKRSLRKEPVTATSETIIDAERAEDFLKGRFAQYIEDYLDSACDMPADGKTPAPDTKDDALYCYKARPLTGIWATAPYLHNGSVPSLRALLSPVDKRPTMFWIGSQKLNVNDVGFDTTQGLAQYHVFHSDGLTPIKGNSNQGHLYGTDLNDDEKEALLGFLRTL